VESWFDGCSGMCRFWGAWDVEDGESPTAAEVEQVMVVESQEEALELFGDAMMGAGSEFQRRRC